MKTSNEILKNPYDLYKQIVASEADAQNPLRQDKGGQGYWAEPNTTSVWNHFFDYLMVGMDEDMLRVTLYLVRHTFGYGKKDGDYITEDQFINGTVNKKTGERIDWGSGLRTSTMTQDSLRSALRRSLRRLEKLKIVYVRRGVKRKQDDKFPTNYYRLYLNKENLKNDRV